MSESGRRGGRDSDPEATLRLLAAADSSARSGTRGRTVEWGALLVDLATYQVFLGGRELELTPTEFDLLRHLLDNRGSVVDRVALARRVLGSATEANLSFHVSNLRAKLGDRDRRLIETIGRRGYAIGVHNGPPKAS